MGKGETMGLQKNEETYIKLQNFNLHNKLRSNPFPLTFISRYFIPGTLTGSASAELDCRSAGILRSLERFLAWFTCSVLGVFLIRRKIGRGRKG